MVEVALKSASSWTASAEERCDILNKTADLYEKILESFLQRYVMRREKQL